MQGHPLHMCCVYLHTAGLPTACIPRICAYCKFIHCVYTAYICVLQVAREVYNTCLTGVLGRKTRVLVTNQLQFVSGADHILYMQDGHIEEQGTYDELIKADRGFAQLMSQAEVSGPDMRQSASHTCKIFMLKRRPPVCEHADKHLMC